MHSFLFKCYLQAIETTPLSHVHVSHTHMHTHTHTHTHTHSYMMYQDNKELHKAASWPGVKGGGRERLMDELQGT